MALHTLAQTNFKRLFRLAPAREYANQANARDHFVVRVVDNRKQKIASRKSGQMYQTDREKASESKTDEKIVVEHRGKIVVEHRGLIFAGTCLFILYRLLF